MGVDERWKEKFGVWLVRTTEVIDQHATGFYALSTTCTHLGCRLQLQAEELICPCHRAIFALDGDVVHYDLPLDLPPLPHFEVREQDGAVQILAPDKKT